MHFRKPNESDFERVYDFVSACKPLESYAVHFYKIMLRYFRNTCLVAEENNVIVGFVLGFVSQVDPKTYFLWQIGVSPEKQGQGIGNRLLTEMESLLKKTRVGRMELTVDPENITSQKLVEKTGFVVVSQKEKDSISVHDKMALKDYYGQGRHFILYEKKVK
jgi:L-2,4-diaminobutyric acid acetyltransferase